MNPALSHSGASERLRVRVRGAVQGVGFRPFVHGLARALELGGFVRNDAEGVLLEIEGARAHEFVAALRRSPPPLARIDAVEAQCVAPKAERQFFIETSVSGETRTRVPADAAVCEECLDELFDPRSRFYRYPFVNCTHCGPALHADAQASFRPRRDRDGALRHVRGLRDGFPRSLEPALSCADDRLSGMRTAPRRADRRNRRLPAQRRHRRLEGRRRISSALRRAR